MKRFLTIAGIILVIIVGFVIWGGYRAGQAQAAALADLNTEPVGTGDLIATIGATGIVQSNQSATLTWDTSGTVDLVNVKSGDSVSAKDVLASLSQTSLPQNVILAQADLVSAEQALEDLMNSGTQAAQALKAVEDAEQALDDALNPALSQAQSSQAIADAEQALEDAQTKLTNTTSPATQAEIDNQKAQLILAEDALERARENFEPWVDKPEDSIVRANFQAQLSTAQANYDTEVRTLNAMLSTGNALDIAVAEAEYATAQAQLLEAQRDFERLKNGASAAEVELLEAQLADAQREFERVKDGDTDEILAAEARVAAAQATLDTAFIAAPFNGIVSSVDVKPGDLVSPGSVAFRVDDLSSLQVDVEVSEVDINRIQVGQDAILTFDAVLAKEYHGTVIEVALVGTEIQGVVNFIVTIELLDADENVRPGMTAGVSIVVSQLNDVVVVPNRAVRILDGERVVYILVEGSPIPTPIVVELGSSSDTHSEVIGGELKVGDQLVLNPPSAGIFGGGPGGPGGEN